MAIKKIKLASTATLWASIVISILVILAFFLGGSTTDAKGNISYNFTEGLMYWSYILFGLTIVATVAFALMSFFAKLSSDPKKAVMSLSGVVFLVIVMGVSYAMGDGTKLTTINADNQMFNTEGWLKFTDMFLYTTYVMFTIVVLAAIWGAVRKVFSK